MLVSYEHEEHGHLSEMCGGWLIFFHCNGISLEGMMLKLKLQYFGHLMQRVESFEKTLMKKKKRKDADAGRDCGQEEKGTTEDEMAGWHH